MRRLKIGSIPLPEVYVVASHEEAMEARRHGIPYIVWDGDDETLVRRVLYPALVRKFPGIKWNKVLGITSMCNINVFVEGGHEETDVSTNRGDESDIGLSDIATEERLFHNESNEREYNSLDIDAFVGDIENYVDIEQLQDLRMLPKFMDDIVDCVRKNLDDVEWWEGWNKKLGCALGRFEPKSEVENLIILDVSGSIPRGISSTMLTMAATMKSQCNANFILTGSNSYWFDKDEPLPKPEEMRRMCGLSNESYMFEKILEEHVSGRHFGNVIAFGDNDKPYIYEAREWLDAKVDCVWNYHTTRKCDVGYAKWAVELCDDVRHNTSWARVMVR